MISFFPMSDRGRSGRVLLAPLPDRRTAAREALAIPVLCQGDGKPIPGVTVDVSVTGMQVELSFPAPPTPGAVNVLTMALDVMTEFSHGMTVHLGGRALSIRADVIRVQYDGNDPATLRLGCRFVTPLTGWQRAELGLAGDGGDAASS